MPTIKLIEFFIPLFLVLLLIGCKNEIDKSEIYEITPGGRFKIILDDPVETLDPKNIIYRSDWKASFLIYEGLVGYSDSLNKIEPLLAKRWEIEDDGHLVRFHLRENVWFHDDPCFPDGKGRRVNADDVVFMLERLAHPVLPSYYYSLFSNTVKGISEFHSGIVDMIEGIKVIDDLTVEFHLDKPFAAFLKLLATPAAYIIPREAVNHYGNDFYRHPVGTGPFRLVVWKPIEELVFVKNEKYWAKDSFGHALPYLDEISIRFRKEGVVSVVEFLKGNNHVLRLDKKGLDNLFSDPGISEHVDVYESIMDLGVRFYGIRQTPGSVLADHKLLRRAIAMSYDRRFLEDDLQDRVVTSNSFVPEALLSNPELRYYPFNQRTAMQMIGGLDLQNVSIKIASSIYCPDLEELEKAITALGLTVDVTVQPMNYYGYIRSGEPDIFRVSMVPSFPDPIDIYSLLYSKSPPTLNLMGYHNPEFDAVFEQSLVEQDPEKRNELFLHLERIIYDDVPVLLLSHARPGYYVLPAYVKGFSLRYMFPDYRKIWFSDSYAAENKNQE